MKFEDLKITEKIRQEAMLKSALSSARIEGNPLTWKDVKYMIDEILSLREKKIMQIIRNKSPISFKQIRDKLPKIPDSTLHYDLRQLRKKGFIKKLGSTRGALYTSV